MSITKLKSNKAKAIKAYEAALAHLGDLREQFATASREAQELESRASSGQLEGEDVVTLSGKIADALQNVETLGKAVSIQAGIVDTLSLGERVAARELSKAELNKLVDKSRKLFSEAQPGFDILSAQVDKLHKLHQAAKDVYSTGYFGDVEVSAGDKATPSRYDAQVRNIVYSADILQRSITTFNAEIKEMEKLGQI